MIDYLLPIILCILYGLYCYFIGRLDGMDKALDELKEFCEELFKSNKEKE